MQSNKELITGGWEQKGDVSHLLIQQSRAQSNKSARCSERDKQNYDSRRRGTLAVLSVASPIAGGEKRLRLCINPKVLGGEEEGEPRNQLKYITPVPQ